MMSIRSSSNSGLPSSSTEMALSTGCWTCRIRRKKCDEEKDDTGSCGTCYRLGLNCLGYGHDRPAWTKDKALLAAYKASIKQRKTKENKLGESSTGVESRPKRHASAGDDLLHPRSCPTGTEPSHPRRKSPHPHDFQPDIPHTTTRQSTTEYWDVAYRFHSKDPTRLVPVSGIIDALLQEAPLSPLAKMAVVFPSLHTQASLSQPAGAWMPRETRHSRLCREVVASYRPGTQVTDDHVLAAVHCVGMVSLSLSPTTYLPITLSLVNSSLTASSIIPNQPPSERAAMIQGSTVKTENGGHIGIRDISALALWAVEKLTRRSFSQREFMHRATLIQAQLYRTGFNTSDKREPAATEEEICEDIHRASALLYLHSVVNAANLDAPVVSAGVDLVIALLYRLGPYISIRNEQTLIFPLAITSAMVRKPEQRRQLDAYLGLEGDGEEGESWE